VLLAQDGLWCKIIQTYCTGICCLIRNQNVKKIILLLSLTAFIVIALTSAASPAGVAICDPSGEILFKRHCSACHHDAVKLKNVKNITDIIRKPPDVMPAFDKNKLSDRSMNEIADYIYQGSDFKVGSKKR
jgi:mono/diheme cytochrome c family protein